MRRGDDRALSTWQNWRARHVLARSDDGERGFTLVEIIISLAVFTVLLGMSIPIVATFLDASTRVANNYVNVNQLLPVSTNLQRLIRSAVAPAPTYFTGIPTPAFGSYNTTSGTLVAGTLSPTSLTFYVNIGDPNGPAKIVASCTANGTTGACTNPGTLTVTEARAVQTGSPAASTCPFAGQTNQLCTWSSSPITLFKVTGLTNGADNVPLFTYTLLQTTTTSGSGGTQTTTSKTVTLNNSANDTPPNVPAFLGLPTSLQGASNAAAAAYALDLLGGYGAPNASPQTGYFGGCDAGSSTLNPDSNCPAAQIEAVTIDIQVNTTASNARTGGSQEEDQSTVYLLSTVSSQYQEEVG
jgi:prepilin-type N-terminal cleavage/methylation domain-containing protein